MTYQPATTEAKQGIITNFVMVVITGMMVIFPIWFFWHSFWDAEQQDRMIRSFQPVEAKVLSSQVTTTRGSKGSIHYHAEIKYQYVAGEKTWVSDRLTALPVWGAQDWAADIVGQYKAGEPCRAYYNPDNPGEAILLHTHSFSPYMGMLESRLPGHGRHFRACTQLRRDMRRKPRPAMRSGFEVLPKSSERNRLLTAAGCTATWYGLGGIAAAHYFTCLQGSHPSMRVNLFITFGIVGLIPLGLLVRCIWINLKLEDAHLFLEQPAARAGAALKYSITQQARRESQVKEIKTVLYCFGKQNKNSETVSETVLIDQKHRVLRPGETAELSGETTLPAHAKPTGRCRSGIFRWIECDVRHTVKFTSGHTYRAIFPIEVQAGATDEPEPAQFAD